MPCSKAPIEKREDILKKQGQYFIEEFKSGKPKVIRLADIGTGRGLQVLMATLQALNYTDRVELVLSDAWGRCGTVEIGQETSANSRPCSSDDGISVEHLEGTSYMTRSKHLIKALQALVISNEGKSVGITFTDSATDQQKALNKLGSGEEEILRIVQLVDSDPKSPGVQESAYKNMERLPTVKGFYL